MLLLSVLTDGKNILFKIVKNKFKLSHTKHATTKLWQWLFFLSLYCWPYIKHEYFHLHMLKCITAACSDIIFNTNQTWTAKYVLFTMSLIRYFKGEVRRTSGSACHWYSRNLRSLVGRGRWLRRWSLSRPTQSLMRWRHSWLSSRGVAAKKATETIH